MEPPQTLKKPRPRKLSLKKGLKRRTSSRRLNSTGFVKQSALEANTAPQMQESWNSNPKSRKRGSLQSNILKGFKPSLKETRRMTGYLRGKGARLQSNKLRLGFKKSKKRQNEEISGFEGNEIKPDFKDDLGGLRVSPRSRGQSQRSRKGRGRRTDSLKSFRSQKRKSEKKVIEDKIGLKMEPSRRDMSRAAPRTSPVSSISPSNSIRRAKASNQSLGASSQKFNKNSPLKPFKRAPRAQSGYKDIQAALNQVKLPKSVSEVENREIEKNAIEKNSDNKEDDSCTRDEVLQLKQLMIAENMTRVALLFMENKRLAKSLIKKREYLEHLRKTRTEVQATYRHPSPPHTHTQLPKIVHQSQPDFGKVLRQVNLFEVQNRSQAQHLHFGKHRTTVSRVDLSKTAGWGSSRLGLAASRNNRASQEQSGKVVINGKVEEDFRIRNQILMTRTAGQGKTQRFGQAAPRQGTRRTLASPIAQSSYSKGRRTKISRGGGTTGYLGGYQALNTRKGIR